MEDISGIGKIIDSKVIERAYEDAASPPAKQIGYIAEDLLKSFRLFTAPIQLLALAQDRFARWLEEIRNSVPEERQVEAAPEVAGPALLNLRFVAEDSVLKTLYLNLLKHAIDRDQQHEVHPGFVRIIEQISPDDAYFLFNFRQVDPLKKDLFEETINPLTHVVRCNVPGLNNWTHERVQATLELFRGLSVINYGGTHRIKKQTNKSDNWISHSVSVSLTQYGHNFVKVCLPETWAYGSQALKK